MWAMRIVLPSPAFNDDLSFLSRVKEFSVQQFVSEFAIKRFHIPILPGTPWLNE